MDSGRIGILLLASLGHYRVEVTLVAPKREPDHEIMLILTVLVKLLARFAEPWVPEQLRNGDSVGRFDYQHTFDEVSRIRGNGHGIADVPAEDEGMEVLEGRGFEGYCALEHGIQQHPQRPNIHIEPIISLIRNNLRRQVRRCPTLLLYHLRLLYKP